MASFKKSVRPEKRLFNLAFGIFGLLIIMLMAAVFAGWRTRTVQADSVDKPVFKPNNKRPINLGLKSSEPSQPPVKHNKNLSRRLATQQSVQGRKQPFVGAGNGEAFLLEEKGKRGVKTNPLKTTLPVFKAFGLSSNNGKLLYTSLKNGVPSGELYLEDLSTGERVRVTTEVVMTAAFSPVNDHQIAYTFADGGGFALAITDLDIGQHRVIVAENVFTEVIEWDNSGKGIHYYETAVQDRNLNLSLKYAQTDSSLAGKDVLPVTPAGFPVLEKSEKFQALIEGKSLDGDYAFSSIAPDGLHEIAGSNLLGVSRLFAYNSMSGKTAALGEGQLVEALPTGVIFKEFSKAGTKLQFADWEGKTTTVGVMVVNYNLPVKNSIMTQGGTGYNAPGNCSITAHAGAMEFAYDFQGAVSVHVLASADGLVVFNTSSMTCNTIDVDACPDYNPNGCPGSFLGNVVIIQHSDGTFTKYAHLETSSPRVLVGTNINQGLYIARQGHTGSTNGDFNGCGDHVHFQRQSSPDLFGQSVAVDFADVVNEPLSCGAAYTSASTEISHSISPSSQNFGISGGNGSVNVTSTGGTWSAVSNDSWITVTSGASGSGNGVVNYSVSNNSAGGQRTGTMNVAGHLFTVTQSGGGVTNQAPTANAGSDQAITLPSNATLSGTASDDGLPNPPATLTTTWSKVSGPGTVSFTNANSLNTTASFSIAGIYILRLTANDSALTATDDVRIVVNTNSGGGTLTGSQASPPASIDLTTEGTADWAHWGLNTPTDFNHKSGVTQQIANYTQIGNISALRYTNSSSSYSWNDGTPTGNVGGTTTGVYVYDIGNGFEFTLPADTTQRTLKLYVGLWAAGGRLEASLSDGSASPYIDTSLVSASVLDNVYTLNYRAASSGQTLTVRWLLDSNSNALGNITLQAATLTSSAPPTNQAPTVNAGNDQTITLPATASLSGTASDDGLPNPPASLTTTWSKVSGAGTVTFGNVNALNTTASFSSAGTYVLRLTASDSVLSATDDVTVTVNNSGGSGLLSATSANTPASVNLTTEGTADWAHWGLNFAGDFNHKANVTQQISNYTVLGSGSIERYTNNPNTYSWSGGTPAAAVNNTATGVYVLGLNNGFQITVPADTTQRTLKLYVGLWAAGGRLEASLSDNSASTYIDTSLVNSGGTSNRVYSLNYRAASGGQTLTVKWTVNTTFNAWSNITFQGAALVGNAPPPTNQAPTVNAGSDQSITLPSNATLSGTATDDGLPNPPAILTTTWSKVSGAGTVTFGNANSLNTTAGFSAAGTYVLRLAANDGALTSNDDVTITVNNPASGGALSATSANTPASVNLTTEGTADWAHWGLNSIFDFNHKANTTQQISNYTVLGSGSIQRYTGNPNAYSWNNGTPTTNEGGTTSGVYVIGANNGFQITVPADTTQRTLKMYVGLWAAGGRLEASLSDGSAPAFVDTSLVNSGGTSNRVYSLNYRAATGGQTLTVRWTVATTFNSWSNVTLQGAALAGSTPPPPPTNQAPTVNAGNDQSITLPSTASLSGTASDDGLPNPPATLTTTWSKVSGAGTVTFGNANALNTTASFSSAGTYVLRLTASDGTLTATDDLTVTVNNPASGGALSANSANAPANVNLTTQGTVDWAHWGLTAPGSFNHKSGITQQISNYTAIGTGTIQRYTNNPNTFTWSGGTPTANANNTATGVYVMGVNNGFQITVPADTSAKTLKLYVGLWAAGGRFEATLSDGSAPAFVDTSLVNSGGTSNRVYTLNYRAATGGQTLTVRWTANTTFSTWGNVTLQAAALINGTVAFAPSSDRVEPSFILFPQYIPYKSFETSGNFISVRQSNLPDGNGYEIFGRRYDAAGNPL